MEREHIDALIIRATDLAVDLGRLRHTVRVPNGYACDEISAAAEHVETAELWLRRVKDRYAPMLRTTKRELGK